MTARVSDFRMLRPAATSDCSTCASGPNPWAARCKLKAVRTPVRKSKSKFLSPGRNLLTTHTPMTTPEKATRILVVDDHFMVRMGLSSSLNVEFDMQVVAEAGSGDAALEAYRKHRPNLVLMDVRLPGMSGADAVAAIVREFPDARILMLSTHSGEEEIYRSLQAGARGYILKSAMREQLLRAIR